jgi:hypothetical protein
MTSIEKTLLKAELMASAPEYVLAWLRARADSSNTEPLGIGGEDELELAFLTRGSGLIELGLARYGYSEVVIRKLGSAQESDSLPEKAQVS